MRRLQAPIFGWLMAGVLMTGMVIANFGRADESPPQGETEPGVDYLHDIKPILHERCFACHGALKQEGNLRLDTAESMLIGGDSGPALVSQKVDESLLIERITATEEYERMPPEGKPLTAEEIAKIKAWVAAGAKAPADEQPEEDPNAHWAFQKLQRPEVPAGDAANPIDAFLAEGREKLNLKTVGPVEKSLLLRRVYLDLIGLPPTRAQLKAFLADESPEAYARVVDELLESPQYGQRWGRHWMDVWRYSDWYGLGAQVRNSQKHVWHWRDWIVDSLNADKGYDQMVREMLAADELYPTDQEKLRATGYLVRNYYLFNRTTWLDDTLEHTSKAFLGLTLNCTKCHDHKYDPITHQEYYQMRAIFEPHQVRLDPVPGETDLEKDGLPRAFDAHADTMTYIHIRGDEKNPDKSKEIQPGVPAVLGREAFKITPVELPPMAYQPKLLPFVLADQLKKVEADLTAAKEKLAKSETELAEIEKAEAERLAAEKLKAAELAAVKPEENKKAEEKDPLDVDALIEAGKVVWEDDFSSKNTDLWKQGAGQWKYENGEVVQSKVGAERAFLLTQKQHPADFDLRLKFQITGGNQWKSVGISFDTTEGREKMVYMSAFAGGLKLQIATKTGGAHTYPPQGALARSVELNQPYELEIKVREKLINISIDGEHALAYELSVPREPGNIAVLTYDAAAKFDHFELRELPQETKLVEAGTKSGGAIGEGAKDALTGPQKLAQAELALEIAKHSLAASQLQAEVIKTAHAADIAKRKDTPEEEVKKLVTAAALAARKYELAQAQLALSTAKQKLVTADEKTKATVEKEVNTAEANLTKAQEAVKNPGEKYSTLYVSAKAPEGPAESQESIRQPYPATSTGRRSALADWMVASENPLTARVAVNHIWLRHFGQPLVESVNDFGRRASRPVQQPLLDWLAVELMENSWSMKHLHRLMVTSEAYQLSTSSMNADEATVQADPENNYYWRRRPVRIESQVLRDSLMHLAGVLDLSEGGPSIDPKQDLAVKRRSMYFTHSRDIRSDFLQMFDDADILACYRRSESIVPQQALTLANSRMSLEMARKIAADLKAELGEVDDEAYVTAAFETILATQPDKFEKQACLEMLTEIKKVLTEQKAKEVEDRARHDLIHALLNHNDFVTIR